MTTMLTSPVVPLIRQQTYSGDVRSATQARRDARDTITGWNLGDITYEAMQIIAEMMANAVSHCAQKPVTVELTQLDNGVRIAVLDSCTEPVVPRQAQPGDENGRGMLLIDEFASRWGWEFIRTRTLSEGERTTGKRVWADVLL